MAIVQLFEAPGPEQIEILQTLMATEQISAGPMHLVSGTASVVFSLAARSLKEIGGLEYLTIG